VTSHPREGYQGGAGADAVTRRQFLGKLGAGAVALGAAPLLAACGSSGTGGSGTTAATLPLPRPNNPVRWPASKSGPAIASNLKPEQGATLQLYNWVAYINQKVVNDFAKRYNCKVQITTFNTMSEAISKLRTGQLPFDVFFPTIDVLGNLIEGGLIRPLNHSYIPNISQAWPDFTNPFYDQGWQYTAPYTIYTTGMAWRKDHVPENPYKMANPWAMPWQPKYKGKVAILDDYREGLSLGLLKNGIYDLNTTNSEQLAAAKQSLLQLNQEVKVQIDNNDYTNVPSGKIWIHHAWSGDMAASAGYMPKGVNVDVVGYWFPTDGKGPVNNDCMTVLASGKNPVLAHLFLNYLLDLNNALENISFNGYMQPINGVTPSRLVTEKILPPSLTSTVVLPSYFRKGLLELQLEPSVDAVWEQDWQQFSGGL
jgi:spermidine/putrescine transport system substrate-binding protein